MNFRKILRWLVVACLLGVVGFLALMGAAILWPRPKPVEGWSRPDWLPAAASDVHYQFQEGFGWWRVAQFTIAEKDLRTYVAASGWKLQERVDYRPTWMRSLTPMMAPKREAWEEEDPETERVIFTIPRALVAENTQANGGGVRLAYDPATSRAYYSESHR